MTIEHIFKQNGVIHVIQLKPSENKKLGYMQIILCTYHFSEEQIQHNNLSYDNSNCMDCPYSFNQNKGKSGGCYTHKGYQRMGLISMLNRLSSMRVEQLNKNNFKSFIKFVSQYNISLARLGVYGDPSTLPLTLIESIVSVAKKYTGYTRQWGKIDKGYTKYLMASTMSPQEVTAANIMGYRAFNIYTSKLDVKGAICPASKEFTGKKLTCATCGICNGGVGKNINIKKH